MNSPLKKLIRPIALSVSVPVVGFFLVFVLEIALKIEVSRLVSSLFNLAVVSLLAFLVFPHKAGIPFGKTSTRQWARQLGFYFPQQGWKHLLLGILLAGCTLSGMLIASLLTGQYKLDWSTVTLTQLVFSLNPGLWEELFYRGVMMIVLIRFTGSIKRAALIQIVIFGLAHIKGFDLWAWVDVFTVGVLAMGFTFAAYKTNALVAGIVFHYLHDALLFLVQLPGGVETTPMQQITFYAILWGAVALGCAVTHLAAEKFNVRSQPALYLIETGANG